MPSHKNKKEQRMPRREFMKTAAAGIAAVSIPAASYARILGANDRVRAGIVGFSDRFRQALLPAFKAAGPSLNFEIIAVSDIWNRRRDEGVAEIERVMEIGRAECRGRGEISVVAGSLKKKKKRVGRGGVER